MPPLPPRKLPPVRMGDRSDQVRRHQAAAAVQHQAEHRIRTRIYQDILALLDLAERLTLDLSAHEDRYGLEWNPLARQICAQYSADVVKIVPGFQAKIMSKEGAHGLPKGLYRDLLDFGEQCAAFVKWARAGNPGENLPRDAGKPPESGYMPACTVFKQACAHMRQQVCIFENERKPGEESFFN